MKYRLTIEKSLVPPKRKYRKWHDFEAKDDAAAYRWVIDEIISKEANRPLMEMLLYRREGDAWVEMMIWRRKSGWSFTGGREPNIVDNRPAPGA